ncbi:hypothetical protein D0T12_13460 [Actinomadura spongiicola]|uniref:Uncharacterized protein n=1 Tax=Actinomadura spongiicola TaxID=2303421 RepID=A0A372GGS3_9ACTN|nr:hypothetical protein D0T12_13460 [Actinomadura spongiicola]
MDESSSTRRIGVIVVAFVVPVVLASVVAFGLRDDPPRKRPETVGQKVTPAVTPEEAPTFGEYVPPEPGPQVVTKAPRRVPAPRVTPTRKRAKPSPSVTRTRRACPPGWVEVRWRHARWCVRQYGHGGR